MSLLYSFKSWLRRDYERNKLNILTGAWTALAAHPAYYFVCTHLLQNYDDSPGFRYGAVLVSIPMLFRSKFPESWLAWLNLYWYFWLGFVLPASFTYILLLNHFAPMWIVCETIMLSLTIICIGNIIGIILVIGLGTFFGYLCYVYNFGESLHWTLAIQTHSYPLWHLVVPLPIAIWCGIILSFGAKQALVSIERTEAIKAFAGSIAHEMRNTITQIKFTFNSILDLLPSPQNTGPETKESFQNSLHIMHEYLASGLNACHRGSQVIDLTLSQVNNQMPDPDSFQFVSAGAIAARGIKEYGFATEEDRARVSLEITKDFIIKVDETACIHILFNLLKNAVYYFKSCPKSCVVVKVEEPQIVITDTGPGIPEQFRSRLFLPFTTQGKKAGTGLGLAYCQRTIQAFGGEISCHSEVGQYTRFILKFLPVKTKIIDHWIENMNCRIRPLLIYRRIMIVDDETVYFRVLQHLLEPLECVIDTAESGQIAINKLSENNYDIIFMDIQMPDKDGYMTCREIRNQQNPEKKNVCIIAHTNEPLSSTKLKTEKFGMDGFLAKPCTRIEVLNEIMVALEAATQRIYLDETDNLLTGETILITDDEEINRRILRVYAREWKMHVFEAESGAETLDILEKNPKISLVLMDIRMAPMDGMETTRQIRARPHLCHVGIVGVTADYSVESLTAAENSGLDDVIIKPAEPKVLKKKLLRLIQNGQRHRPSPEKPTNSTNNTDSSTILSTLESSASNQNGVEQQLSDEFADIDGILPFTNQQVRLVHEMKLLDDQRLTEYQISFKEEFHDFLTDMINHLQSRSESLHTAFANKNFQAVLGTLHSLIGLSGYIGAQALNRYIKLQVHPHIREDNYLNETTWITNIHRLTKQSIHALHKKWGPTAS